MTATQAQKRAFNTSLLWLGGMAALAIALLVLLTSHQSSGAASGSLSKAQRAEVEAIVRDYILANPEIIPEAVNRLQQREVTAMIAKNRDAIETPFASAWAGAKDADVTLVEFFDYNCSYCRASYPAVQRLLKEDRKLRVVYRELPILSEESTEAAMASLSAAKQGKFKAFHRRMFTSSERLNTQKIIRIVRAAGLNESRTARDVKNDDFRAEIEKNMKLGGALGLTGTPSYVIGDQVLTGAVGYDALKDAIAKARSKG